MTRFRWLFILFSIMPFCLTARSFGQSGEDGLGLRVEPAYFSPNGDGFQDQVFFYPVLQKAQNVTRWRLDIMKPIRRKLRRLTGPGFPALVKWDGFDKKGKRVLDGDYVAIFEGRGSEGRLSIKTELFVDTLSPLVKVSVSTPTLDINVFDESKLVFNLNVEDSSPLHRWQLQILDLTGHTVFLAWSEGAVHDVEWDGKDQATGSFVPQGTYRCIFQAWDKAGNGSDPASLDVGIKISAQDILRGSLKAIKVNETEAGFLIQLKSEELFVEEKGKVFLADQGRAALKDVALFINAYSDFSVLVDGYSSRKKGAWKNQQRSSVYAWRVFSELVKEGKVKAARLTVKGHGTVRLPERARLSYPFMRDGIEILVQKKQEPLPLEAPETPSLAE